MTTKTFKRGFVPLLLAACFGAAVAAPTGQQVVAGQATFSQQGNVFSITNTPGTIINWQSFSIGQGEIARFIQQGADSAVLNRIVGQDPSRILGALQSNGKVFLINPNGIMFGKDSRVDVNGLVASSLNMTNADFLTGKKNFTAGPSAGAVRNEGAITTPSGGQVFLIAPNVANAGVIKSPQGEVVLAAGHSVQLVDSRDPDLHVVVSAPDDHAINLGRVVAQGGRIGIYGALVNQRGLVSANSAVVGENGKIVLKASRETLLEQGSVTSATGTGKGGDVHLLGERVGLAGNAMVDASGATGGGKVFVGGGWQGKDASLANASKVLMGKDASIRADARDTGNGGQVVLWSNDATSAHGSISARGGAQGGDGGKVETSGHRLDVAGLSVRAGAAKGKAGTWLLDPYDIEVVDTATSATAADVAVSTAGAATGVTKVAPSVLNATGTDIVLQAQHDLTITDAISTGASVTGRAGHDINVNADVTTANGSVMFSAGSNIRLAALASIKSNNYIDLIADQMYLDGNIGGAGSQLPAISFATSSANRPIVVAQGAPATSSALSLDAAALSRFSAYEINIGTGANTGGVNVGAAITQSAHLGIDSAGPISINAAISLGTGSTFTATLHGGQGSLLDVNGAVTGGAVYLTGDGLRISKPITASTVQLMPHSVGTEISLGALDEGKFSLTDTMLSQVRSDDLTIGGLPGYASFVTVAGTLDLSSHPFGKLTLDAGEGPLSIGAPFTMPGGTLVLKSNVGIVEGSTAGLNVDKLAVRGANVSLMGDNTVGTLAGASSSGLFLMKNSGALHIGDAGGMSGITASEGEINLATGGALVLDKGINAPDTALVLDVGGINGAGKVKGSSLFLHSTDGVGTTTAPLNTEVQVLHVANDQVGGKPINVQNTGELLLIGAYQNSEDPSKNTGGITIGTSGSLTLPAGGIETSQGLAAGPVEYGEVRAQSGGISLAATDHMVIGGKVSSTSGSISLSVPNGTVIVNDGARVASASGDISVVAATTHIPDGAITSTSGKVTQPGSAPPPPPPPAPVPTLEQCVANANVAGCGAVIEAAKQECSINPAAPHCADVMPSVDACKTNPAATGCQSVLQQEAVKQCVAHPEAASCGGTLDYCTAHPGTPSCDVLAQKRNQIDACVDNPKAAGCSAVLPTYDACAAAPSTYGCGPAVTEHNAIQECISNPNGPTCVAVLPQYLTCSAKPDTFGCAPVVAKHDAVQACMVKVSDPACASILPTPAVCTADISIFGCSAVIARQQFLNCVANPVSATCDAILPPLAVCKASPSQEGCASVIGKTFNFCLTSPGDARCEGILPTISQCIGDKTKPGCTAVLPTINQCVATPARQGCAVILPELSVCKATPSQEGCSAVIKMTFDFCLTSPGDARCDGILPTISQCIGDKTRAGCGVVLPTLGQCVASPATQGCNVILPSLSVCKATPSQEGCSTVLQNTFDFCLTSPGDARCVGILPTISQCIGDKSQAGCAVVLPTMNQCLVSPSLQGCSVILPELSVCKTRPSQEGCAAVIKTTFDFCVTSPGDARCDGILPTISQCIGDKTTAGCAVVLPTMSQCVIAPTQPGCSVILPELSVCKVTPSQEGCSAVIKNTFSFCLGSPGDARCIGILPTISQCIGDKTKAGCAVVLPTLSQCVTSPVLQGCSAVLPELSLCIVTPSVEGCSSVIKTTLDACLVKPNDASCTGVLPTISQCVADKSRTGCTVVLPTLAQCAVSPTLQGCAVILPKFEQCVADPTQLGCAAVLPRPDFCSTHPSDPTCAVFGSAPPGSGGSGAGKEVSNAVQTTVTLVNTSTPGTSGTSAGAGSVAGTGATGSTGLSSPASGGTNSSSANSDSNSDKPSEKQAGPATSEKSGAKNEKPATKTYCN